MMREKSSVDNMERKAECMQYTRPNLEGEEIKIDV